METNIPGVYAAGDLRIKITSNCDGGCRRCNCRHSCATLRDRTKTQAGQPIVTKRMTERLANQSAPETNSQQPKEKQPAKVTGKHHWFPESMRQQLSGIFAKLTKK